MILLLTTAKRSPSLPQAPTITESGFPGFNALAWWVVIVPRKTPPAIVNAINLAVTIALKTPEVSDKLKTQGIQIVAGDREMLGDFIGKQIVLWGKFAIENNIKEAQ